MNSIRLKHAHNSNNNNNKTPTKSFVSVSTVVWMEEGRLHAETYEYNEA